MLDFKPTEDIISMSEFRTTLADCVARTAETHRPIILTQNGRATSVFLSAADFAYFYALGLDGAMISIVSMVRRGSVVVSFLFGAMAFHEKNLKSKVVDLLLVLLSMMFLFIGSQH